TTRCEYGWIIRVKFPDYRRDMAVEGTQWRQSVQPAGTRSHGCAALQVRYVRYGSSDGTRGTGGRAGGARRSARRAAEGGHLPRVTEGGHRPHSWWCQVTAAGSVSDAT